jgi:hypothetical protein
MKRFIFCSGLVIGLGLTALGQGQQTSRISGSQSSNANASARQGNKSGDVSLAQGTRIDGELQKTVDVKNAHVGDEVLLKTTRDIKQNGRTVVSKGSVLMGHVTDVARRSKQNGTSRLGMVFDRVQGKNLDAPINASIVSLIQAAASVRAADMADADVFGSSNASGSSSRSSSSSSGGGLLGGAGNTVGGLTGGVTDMAGGVVNSAGQTVGGVTNTAGRTLGNTTGRITQSANGIQIFNSNSASGSAPAGGGSILSSSRSDIRLEKGATLGLELNSSTSASASRGH